MNIAEKFKGALVPEYKTFNQKLYDKLADIDLNNKKMTTGQYITYNKMMLQLINIEMKFRKEIVPVVHKVQFGLILIMVGIIGYVAVLGIPMTTKEYKNYQIGIAYKEKMKNEKPEVKIINDEKHGIWCDIKTGYIYIDGEVSWKNGCK